MTPRFEAFGWDGPAFHALNRDLGPAVDALVRFCAGPASAISCGALLLAYCIWRWRRRATPIVLAAVLATVGTDLLGARLLKPGLARTRPCYALPPGSFRQVIPIARSGSLPSQHAANWFAAVTPVVIAAPPTAVVLVPLAVVVSLSRVVAGVHWPSDVLAGALVGTLMGLLATLLVRVVQGWWRRRAAVAALRAPRRSAPE